LGLSISPLSLHRRVPDHLRNLIEPHCLDSFQPKKKFLEIHLNVSSFFSLIIAKKNCFVEGNGFFFQYLEDEMKLRSDFQGTNLFLHVGYDDLKKIFYQIVEYHLPDRPTNMEQRKYLIPVTERKERK
jgi:hypothetical protein